MLRFILVVCVLCTTVSAKELRFENRIRNREPGICRWACAESIGRQCNLTATKGLCDQVVESDIGYNDGAGWREIAFWSWFKGFIAESYPPESILVLRARCESDLVIVTMSPWHSEATKAHAIVVLDITNEKSHGYDGNGVEYNERWVTFFDPNYPETDWVLPESEFVRCWIESHVILPVPQ